MPRTPHFPRRTILASGLALGAAGLVPKALAADQIKVAGIHGSPVESAWNSVLHKALQGAAAEGKIDYVFSEGVAGTDYPRAMSEFAEQGVKLVIGETFPVERQARQVAADYPETAFVMGSSGKASGDNFGIFGTWNYDGAYLAGMLAGKMTKSNVVGSVGAIPIPEINLLNNAFEAVVMSVNPVAIHLVIFIGTCFGQVGPFVLIFLDAQEILVNGVAHDLRLEQLIEQRIGLVRRLGDRQRAGLG